MIEDFKELPTDDLIERFRSAYVTYWELANALTLKASKKSSGRPDLDQFDLCLRITDEIQSRPLDEVLTLKRLLEDTRPEVRLEAARALEDFDFEAALRVLSELAARNLGANGYADPFGVQARLALDRLISSGRVPTGVYPKEFD